MTSKRPTSLYKIPSEGRCMGVCAGIADYSGINVKAVRIVTILLALFTGFWFVVAAYFILGFVLDEKPGDLYEDEREEEFWRQTRRSPDYTAAEMRQRFRDIERRTRDMEAYMTSKRFHLEREINSLKD